MTDDNNKLLDGTEDDASVAMSPPEEQPQEAEGLTDDLSLHSMDEDLTENSEVSSLFGDLDDAISDEAFTPIDEVEPVEEPVAEAIAEPVEEPVEEAIAEPVEEPIAEAVDETVAEAIVEPVEEAEAEAIAEPVEESTAVPEAVEEPIPEPVEEAIEEVVEEEAQGEEVPVEELEEVSFAPDAVVADEQSEAAPVEEVVEETPAEEAAFEEIIEEVPADEVVEEVVEEQADSDAFAAFPVDESTESKVETEEPKSDVTEDKKPEETEDKKPEDEKADKVEDKKPEETEEKKPEKPKKDKKPLPKNAKIIIAIACVVVLLTGAILGTVFYLDRLNANIKEAADFAEVKDKKTTYVLKDNVTVSGDLTLNDNRNLNTKGNTLTVSGKYTQSSTAEGELYYGTIVKKVLSGGGSVVADGIELNVPNTVVKLNAELKSTDGITIIAKEVYISAKIDATDGNVTIRATKIVIDEGITVSGDLIVNGSSDTTINAPVTADGAATLYGGKIDINNTLTIDGNASFTYSDAMTLASGGKLAVGGELAVSVKALNAGETITVEGNFNAAVDSMNLTSAITAHALTIQPKTTADTILVNGTITTTQGVSVVAAEFISNGTLTTGDNIVIDAPKLTFGGTVATEGRVVLNNAASDENYTSTIAAVLNVVELHNCVIQINANDDVLTLNVLLIEDECDVTIVKNAGVGNITANDTLEVKVGSLLIEEGASVDSIANARYVKYSVNADITSMTNIGGTLRFRTLETPSQINILKDIGELKDRYYVEISGVPYADSYVYELDGEVLTTTSALVVELTDTQFTVFGAHTVQVKAIANDNAAYLDSGYAVIEYKMAIQLATPDPTITSVTDENGTVYSVTFAAIPYADNYIVTVTNGEGVSETFTVKAPDVTVEEVVTIDVSSKLSAGQNGVYIQATGDDDSLCVASETALATITRMVTPSAPTVTIELLFNPDAIRLNWATEELTEATSPYAVYIGDSTQPYATVRALTLDIPVTHFTAPTSFKVVMLGSEYVNDSPASEAVTYAQTPVPDAVLTAVDFGAEWLQVEGASEYQVYVNGVAYGEPIEAAAESYSVTFDTTEERLTNAGAAITVKVSAVSSLHYLLGEGTSNAVTYIHKTGTLSVTNTSESISFNDIGVLSGYTLSVESGAQFVIDKSALNAGVTIANGVVTIEWDAIVTALALTEDTLITIQGDTSTTDTYDVTATRASVPYVAPEPEPDPIPAG